MMLPWVKPGWHVKLTAKAGHTFNNGFTELVGSVTQIYGDDDPWMRIGSFSASYLVRYSELSSIQILDSTKGLDVERVDPE